MDERALIARFEAAGVDDLVGLLRGEQPGQAPALQAYLGPERYGQLRSLAIRVARGRTRGRPSRGRVVVVPGLYGSALSVSHEGTTTPVWPAPQRLAGGAFRRLRLADDGRSPFYAEYHARPTGVLNREYAALWLTLAAGGWDVRSFAYDWRKDVTIAGAELEAFARAEFGEGPFSVVAHSTGGLVARALLRRLGERDGGLRCERVVMLGTPNAGTFAAVRLLAGADPLFERIARLAVGEGASASEIDHEAKETRKVVNSFVSLYQMLPRPEALEAPEVGRALWLANTYTAFDVPVSKPQLDHQRDWWERLGGLDDPDRVVAIVGRGWPTATRVESSGLKALNSDDGYVFTRAGDGVVPLRLARLPRDLDRRFRTYVVESDHAGLVEAEPVLSALDALLRHGRSDHLPLETGEDAGELEVVPPGELKRARSRRADRFASVTRRLRALAVRRGEGQDKAGEVPRPADLISPDERRLRALLGGGFLPGEEGGATRGSGGRTRVVDVGESEPPAPMIGLELANLGIERIHDLERWEGFRRTATGQRLEQIVSTLPVDAIAVGHYLGVPPLRDSSLDAIGRAVSANLGDATDRGRGGTANVETILTQYIDRGIIRGELGQPFFLPDPREPSGTGRLVVVAGMGPPGRFGRPELSVLVRELGWSLARLGKRHLATVLIGAGVGNLPVADAVQGWLHGLELALRHGRPGAATRLERVTLVEIDPFRTLQIDGVLRAELESAGERARIDYRPLDRSERDRLGELAARQAREREEARVRTMLRRVGLGDRIDAEPRGTTRVTMTRERDGYQFGALTDTASIPQRKVVLDAKLVEQANDELVLEADPQLQKERGQFLGHLLIPSDLRPRFFTRDPLVLMLDAATARVHWEMVAQSAWEMLSTPGHDASAIDAALGDSPFEFFLGTCRGLTRQLRTTFAPPPEPPPPPSRTLRVLVVADPAADARLPGAEQEGVEVADLFESLQPDHCGGEATGGVERVVVTRLIGPYEATPTNVLREVMSRPYDVLHFAGHCFFNEDDPPSSGWVFSGGQVLSAHEMNRIDRVPKLVFSNACESGVTPDRPEGRTVELAPSFAEAFFARGVANFVCTAWPVDDLAAREFALHLYAALLGLGPDPGGRRDDRPARRPRLLMFDAMREARLAIAQTPHGARSWGAFQHYGNPYYRLFSEADPQATG